MSASERPGAGVCRQNLEQIRCGTAARSAITGAGTEHAATASSSAARASTRISRNAWQVRRASSRRSISRPSAVRPRGSLPYTWSMNGPESKPCSWPTRKPSDSSAPARDAAASAPKRQARGEVAGRSRWSSANDAACALSVPVGIQRRLGELAHAVQLVGGGGRAVAGLRRRARAAARSNDRCRRGPRPAPQRRRATRRPRRRPRAGRRSARASRARTRASRRCRPASGRRSPRPRAGTRTDPGRRRGPAPARGTSARDGRSGGRSR